MGKKIRIVSAIIGLTWLALFVYTMAISAVDTPEMVILPLIAFIFSLHIVLKGPTKKSSMFGKILIFGGILALIVLMVDKGLAFANMDALIRTLAVITGLFFEKVSPHKKLKKFMLLAISTKVQFILVTALLSVINVGEMNDLFFLEESWYIIIILMIVSVVVLAFEKINVYRAVVWTTTIISIILFIDIASNSADRLVTIIALVAMLWPIITTRLVGRKVFFSYEDSGTEG